MSRNTREKAALNKWMSESDNSGSKKNSKKSPLETEAAIPSSGKNKKVKQSVKPTVATRTSGRKRKAVQYEGFETSMNNNATVVEKVSNTSGGNSNSAKKAKSSSTPAKRREMKIAKPVKSKANQLVIENDRVVHDEESDARQFEYLDNLDGTRPGSDGIDVSIDASDDEFGEYDNIMGATEHVESGLHSASPVDHGTVDHGTVRRTSANKDCGNFVDEVRPTTTAQSNAHFRSTSTDIEVDQLRQENLNLKLLLDEMVNQRVKQKMAEQQSISGEQNNGRGGKKKNARNMRDNLDITKSPSDTTIYIPALKQAKRMDNTLDQISNFVEGLRITSNEQNNQNKSRGCNNVVMTQGSIDTHDLINTEFDHIAANVNVNRASNQDRQPYPRRSLEHELDCVEEEDQRRRARDKADRSILDAEKFRAEVAIPKGKVPSEVSKEIHLKRLLDNDDDFFHVTCHIDSAIKENIRNGEFVELEKLLPRERGSVALNASGEDFDFKTFLQAISRGGSTYLRLQLDNRDKKINSIRKWEQAFRVYAAIYTEAHPGRAAEIWQYVYTINTAALSFSWDNVYYYDQTFRCLMEEKPWRSWSKTYTQGWNIAMRDNIGMSHNRNYSNAPTVGPMKKKDWKDECCWKYNKNKCKNRNCSYDHRCTYCGGWNHGYYNCRKRNKRDSNGSTGSNSGATNTTAKKDSPNRK